MKNMQFWIIWITLLIILYFVLEIRYPNIWGNMTTYIDQNSKYLYDNTNRYLYRGGYQQIPTMSRATRTTLIVLCVILLLIIVLNLFIILRKMIYR